MKPAARNFLVSIAVLGLALCVVPAMRYAQGVAAPASAPAAAAAATPARSMVRDLLAFGTEERFWSADVIPLMQGKPSGGTKTFLRVRGPGDSEWKGIGELDAPALSLAHRGTELLVVLEDGDWKIVSDSGARSGNPLPGRAAVIALAGDGDDVWAIGVPPAGAAAASTSATTAPTTTAATTSAPLPTTGVAPTTSPAAAAAEQLGLYLLHRGDWARRDALPGDLDRGDLNAVSLAVLDRKLLLASVDSEGVIRLFTHNPAGGWDKGAEIAVSATPSQTRLRLLDLRGRPALWVSDKPGPGSLYIAAGGAHWQGPIVLQPSPNLANFDRMALATALGQIRLLASDGKQRLAEQIYNPDGTLSGSVTQAITAPSPLDNRVAQLIQMFVVVILFIWMMGALRQRPDPQEAARRVAQLNVAPIGRRALGGAIDLLPIVIGVLVASRFAPPAAGDGAAVVGEASRAASSAQMAWIAAGMGMYLLHTTLFELLFARSVGKFVTGTRVSSLDGARPTPLALLTRNLLRIVDIVLILPPIFIFFSPLRQRIGDMAAGTLVVMDKPLEPVGDADEGDADATPPSTNPPAPPTS
ncbi:MAG: hypothetical protein QOE14_2451 [Humisphaera sp.]|nr:hypothetical protein [Humisphaera sp.]